MATKAESNRNSQRRPAKASTNAVKVAEKPKARSAAKPATAAKPPKVKLMRDSFTMPEPEYALLSAMKKRCLAKGLAAKKSEVLRAAVIGLAAKSDTALVAALKALPVVKTGRPPKGKK